MVNDLEKLKAFVKTAVMEMRDCGIVDFKVASLLVKAYDPQLWRRFDPEYVQWLAQETLESQDREASVRFTELFESFNRMYFDFQLRRYQVRVVYLVEVWIGEEFLCAPALSSIDLDRRCIYICLREDPSEMVHHLLDMMAHAGINSDKYGESWLQEMQRLQRLGAPVLPQYLKLHIFLNAYVEDNWKLPPGDA